jgi:hypothetical protein
VLAGGTRSLHSAQRIAVVASFYSRSFGRGFDYGPSELSIPGFNVPKWVNSNELAFRWEDANGIIQAVAVNVATHSVRWLTASSTDVTAFAVSGDLTVYAAKNPKPRGTDLTHGAIVEAGYLLSALEGFLGRDTLADATNDVQIFIRYGGRPATRGIVDARTVLRFSPSTIAISPCHNAVLLDATPVKIPDSWNIYKDPVIGGILIPAMLSEPRSPQAALLKQLFVLDLGTGVGRPLYDAPYKPGSRVAWDDDCENVVLADAFLPATAPEASLPIKGNLAVNVRTGVATRRPSDVSSSTGEKSRRPLPSGPSSRKAVRIFIRQGLNQPPVLVAKKAHNGGETLVLDPNPTLSASYDLGKASRYSWKADDGRTWRGILYLPSSGERGGRLPLVIQTHSPSGEDEFSLYGTGPGLGPGYTVFAARVLTGRGIAVLEIEEGGADVVGTTDEADIYQRGYESAVHALAAQGVIDPKRLGLVGMSRTGWHVEYALAQSNIPWSAAIVSDNTDMGYLQDTMISWWREGEIANGGPPFHQSLSGWLERAPGFMADRIVTPLRMQIESGGLGALSLQWELFGRLRRLHRPVELFVIPFIDQGSHGIQNPDQVVAAKQSAVDWFDFWLNSRVDPDPAKAKQYKRWRTMREQHDQLLCRPRKSRLHWSSTPKD